MIWTFEYFFYLTQLRIAFEAEIYVAQRIAISRQNYFVYALHVPTIERSVMLSTVNNRVNKFLAISFAILWKPDMLTEGRGCAPCGYETADGFLDILKYQMRRSRNHLEQSSPEISWHISRICFHGVQSRPTWLLPSTPGSICRYRPILPIPTVLPLLETSAFQSGESFFFVICFNKTQFIITLCATLFRQDWQHNKQRINKRWFSSTCRAPHLLA